MGQIETKEEDKQNRKSILNNEVVNEDKSSMADVKIKIDDRFVKDYNNSNDKQSVMDEKGSEDDSEKDVKALEEESKARACDFTCTIFYLLCAVLLFSTVAKTITFHSGGVCNSVYQIQPIIAYICVGLAFCIIRRLRQKIKEQVAPQSIDLVVGENLFPQTNKDSNGYEFKSPMITVDTLPDIKVTDPYPEKKQMEKSVHFGSQEDNKPLSIIYPNNDANKSNTILLLPMLPPPTGGKRKAALKQNESLNPSIVANKITGNADEKCTKINGDERNDNMAIGDKSVSQLNQINCNNYKTLRPDNLITDVNAYWNSYDLNNMNKF